MHTHLEEAPLRDQAGERDNRGLDRRQSLPRSSGESGNCVFSWASVMSDTQSASGVAWTAVRIDVVERTAASKSRTASRIFSRRADSTSSAVCWVSVRGSSEP